MATRVQPNGDRNWGTVDVPTEEALNLNSEAPVLIVDLAKEALQRSGAETHKRLAKCPKARASM